MFICEICKKNQATVHLTDIHENQKQELHLCQSCAEAKGIAFQNSFSLPDLLSGLAKKERKDIEAQPDVVCPECGLHFSEFQSRGRFGCARDYEAFREELLPMIDRIHGRTKHVGKSVSHGAPTQKQQELAALQRRMREAVEAEAYEEAAELRDRIRQMKQDMQA